MPVSRPSTFGRSPIGLSLGILLSVAAEQICSPGESCSSPDMLHIFIALQHTAFRMRCSVSVYFSPRPGRCNRPQSPQLRMYDLSSPKEFGSPTYGCMPLLTKFLPKTNKNEMKIDRTDSNAS
ncbi:hypothetical protein GQ43DRAFT_286797 [Delitschia confertaspora ATCC 74209]|uniref:Secreted protein n=1 Tax=Delitschia confertaspora ATCC 74209 TaxID=1513339 RepID=A0A9P4JTS0_9PLEO|nr:hypothetical protein GQ43DRAFT_286797 [Delitschia confertaspora ATCC 74209]